MRSRACPRGIFAGAFPNVEPEAEGWFWRNMSLGGEEIKGR